ncbi:MAG: hypothetical protein ACRDAG_03865 [Cetobacterium somerae]|uniref:hypothetical protein n=1 Tax=Cetobacterium somerae TaxID=188913 RepID=UPI003F31555C
MIKKYLRLILLKYIKKSETVDCNEVQIISKKIYKIGETKPFTGKVISKYENNQIRYEENYKKGKPHGLRKTFKLNGQLKYEEEYKQGKYIIKK